MARTTRRKNAYQAKYEIDRPEDVSSWDLRRFGVTTPEQCVARQKARFHRDQRSGLYSVPAWFSRLGNRKAARAAKAEIFRCVRANEWDDHLPLRQSQKSRWYWW